jgi:hypothetical protein
LRREGFEVFRVNDDEVIANLPSAFSTIEQAIRSRLGAPPLTPPHKGEGDA